MRADRQTDRQTDTVMAILLFPNEGGVKHYCHCFVTGNKF